MKRTWKVVLLLTAVAAVACTKEWTGRRAAAVPPRKSPGASNAVFASEWTNLSNWQKDPKGYYSEQTLIKDVKKGKVLLFARNLWKADESEDTTDIPLQLPLQFLPYNDQPGLTENWQYEFAGDKLRVNLSVEGSEASAEPREIAVRYVVVPEQVWQELATQEPEAASLPYEDLVAKLDLKP